MHVTKLPIMCKQVLSELGLGRFRFCRGACVPGQVAEGYFIESSCRPGTGQPQGLRQALPLNSRLFAGYLFDSSLMVRASVRLQRTSPARTPSCASAQYLARASLPAAAVRQAPPSLTATTP